MPQSLPRLQAQLYLDIQTRPRSAHASHEYSIGIIRQGTVAMMGYLGAEPKELDMLAQLLTLCSDLGGSDVFAR